MAKSIDTFDDLADICPSDDSLMQTFNKAANHLQSLLPNVDNQTLLLLYGYYKQGSQGPCDISTKPSWYDIKAKSKWESWMKLGDMPQDQAKLLYIETIKKLDPDFKENSSNETKESWVSVSVMKNDCDVKESDKTLTDYVKEGNCLKVQGIIINKSRDLNLLDNEGLGLVHWAADRGSVDVLKILINAGIDINLQDLQGQTALHYAASCGHFDCVKFLLQNGANKNILDHDQCNALSLADDADVRELLV